MHIKVERSGPASADSFDLSQKEGTLMMDKGKEMRDKL